MARKLREWHGMCLSELRLVTTLYQELRTICEHATDDPGQRERECIQKGAQLKKLLRESICAEAFELARQHLTEDEFVTLLKQCLAAWKAIVQSNKKWIFKVVSINKRSHHE